MNSKCAAILVVLASAGSGALLKAQDNALILIKAQQVFVGDGQVIAPGQVLVRDGKIAEVGSEISLGDQNVQTLEVVALLPGLIDAYSQAGMFGSQNAEFTEEFTPQLQVTQAIDWQSRAFRELLEEGVTCIHAAPDAENVFGGLTAVIKTAGKNAADRTVAPQTALAIAACSDPAQRNRSRSRPDSIYVRQPTNRMGVIWLLRSRFHQAQVINQANQEAVEPGTEVLVRALRRQLPVLGFSRTHYDILALLSVGQEFGFTPIVVGGQEAWRVADELSAAKASVVLGPQIPGIEKGPEDTRLCAATSVRLDQAGVPFCFSGPALLDQARFAVRFGLSRASALQAITSTPASLLGVQERVGMIAAGKDADMIALAGDPFEVTSAMQWVMVNGTLHIAEASP